MSCPHSFAGDPKKCSQCLGVKATRIPPPDELTWRNKKELKRTSRYAYNARKTNGTTTH